MTSPLIGIFGGTFDPIHLGHLHSIKLLDEEIRFARIHWVLSARPPHKDQVMTSIQHRFAMLQLALQASQHYYPDDREINRTEKSYTIDTVQQFRCEYPNAKLCLIIGGDSLLKLHTWSRYEALIEQIHLIVMHRPGYVLEVPDYLQDRLIEPHQLGNYDAGKLVLFRPSEFDVSSTKLRQALSQEILTKSNQLLIEQFIAPSVLDYIQQQRLYKTV
ncbi:nicotinate (nicotinamide) nucleotide adenylyltransferase [Arenicella sp.]|nr:nicotinate (nicotinamide) nucleotide adenylyltransferase [Arenicella sp.]